MERHHQGEARVIPVILRSVYWQLLPFSQLQALPPDGKPVMSSAWHDPDEALQMVAEEIHKVIKQLTSSPRVSVSTSPVSAPKPVRGKPTVKKPQFTLART